MKFIPLWNLVKSCLVKYFKWLQKVIKANQVNGILLLDQTTKGTLEAQKAQCPSVEA